MGPASDQPHASDPVRMSGTPPVYRSHRAPRGVFYSAIRFSVRGDPYHRPPCPLARQAIKVWRTLRPHHARSARPIPAMLGDHRREPPAVAGRLPASCGREPGGHAPSLRHRASPAATLGDATASTAPHVETALVARGVRSTRASAAISASAPITTVALRANPVRRARCLPRGWARLRNALSYIDSSANPTRTPPPIGALRGTSGVERRRRCALVAQCCRARDTPPPRGRGGWRTTIPDDRRAI
jgi:hypothetical protein